MHRPMLISVIYKNSLMNNELSEVVDILLPVTFYFNPSTRLDNATNFWLFVICLWHLATISAQPRNLWTTINLCIILSLQIHFPSKLLLPMNSILILVMCVAHFLIKLAKFMSVFLIVSTKLCSFSIFWGYRSSSGPAKHQNTEKHFQRGGRWYSDICH